MFSRRRALNVVASTSVLALTIVGGLPVYHSFAATPSCTQTLSAGANVATAVSNAAADSVICLNDGNYSNFTLNGVNKTSDVIVRSVNGVNANIGYISLSSSNHIKLDSVTVKGGYLNSNKNVTIANSKFTAYTRIDGTAAGNDNILIDNNTFDNIPLDPTGLEGRLSICGGGGTNGQPVGIVVSNNHFGGGGNTDGVFVACGTYGAQVGPGNEFENLYNVGNAHIDSLQLYVTSHTVIIGNYIHDVDTAIMAPDGGTAETVTNNVINTKNGYPSDIVAGSWKGGTITHNTLTEGVRCQPINQGTNCSNIVLRDNVIIGGLTLNANATSQNDYNLIPGGGGGTHGINGSPTFVGGASPTSLAGFALATSSLGKNVASDGKDIGADVSGATPPPADVTPPTVSLTAPAAGATLSGSVPVTADASDDTGVVGVQFKVDGTSVGAEDTTAPYAISWDTITVSNGDHIITAVARDAAGNATTSSDVVAAVDNVPDTTPPSVTMTAPTATTVSGVITVSADASDDVGVAGVQFKLDGANLKSEVTTSPYAISWDTTTIANGSHTLTAVARDATGNTMTAINVTVTVSNTTAVSPVVDKTVTTNQSSASSTIVSPAFTTAQTNELLVAFISSDGPSASAQSFKTVTGGGVTWTLRKRVNTQAGTSEIWTAAAPSILTNVKVTAARNVGSYAGSITVVTFTGADLAATGATAGANATTGAPSVSLTATRSGSVVWGVGNDWDQAVSRTVPSNQTMVKQYLAPVGDTFWLQRVNTPATVGSTVTVNDTTPTTDRWNLASIEILPKL